MSETIVFELEPTWYSAPLGPDLPMVGEMRQLIADVSATDPFVGFGRSVSGEQWEGWFDGLQRDLGYGRTHLMTLRHAGALVFMAQLRPTASNNNKHLAWITQGMTAPALQGNGIVWLAWSVVLAKCDELGIEKVLIDVRSNTRAERRWLAAGMQVFGYLEDYARVDGISHAGTYLHRPVAELWPTVRANLAAIHGDGPAPAPQPAPLVHRTAARQGLRWGDTDATFAHLAKRALEEIIRREQPRRVIEIGCGSGELLHRLPALLDRDASVSGFEDPSFDGQPIAGVSVQRGSFDELERHLEPRSYDLVICRALFAHVTRPPVFVDRLRSLLSEGGMLLLIEDSEPVLHIDPVDVQIDRLRRLTELGHRERGTDRRTNRLTKRLCDAGFTVRRRIECLDAHELGWDDFIAIALDARPYLVPESCEEVAWAIVDRFRDSVTAEPGRYQGTLGLELYQCRLGSA